MVKRTLEVAENPFGSHKVNLPRIVHVKANLLDSIGNVRTGEGQVLKSSHKAAVVSGVNNSRTIISRNLGAGVNRGGAWFAVTHAMASQDVQSILALGEK